MIWLHRFFHLDELGSRVPREIAAGVTTFAAMSYILAVNPQILGTTGMDKGAVLTATAVASAVMTVLMALLTNYPIALAPGMGLNAFFAFTLCAGMGVPWQAALGLVFYSGVLFFILSVTGLRTRIIQAIPFELKIAITSGIGLFIAFIGLRNGEVVTASPATFVTLNSLVKPEPLLTLAGIGLIGVLTLRRVPGALILGVACLSAIGLFLPGSHGGTVTPHPHAIVSAPASLAPTFLQFDLTHLWKNFGHVFPALLSLFFVDLFDNMGTLIGVTQRAGLLDQNGQLPKMGRAFMADATAAMFGSSLGTSTVTSYIESTAGVEAGGRSGLTTITTAACFLLALFFTPLILLVPAAATAPALVVVGAFMLQGIGELDLKDFSKTLPAFVTMIMMPLAFSISEGISLGMIIYVLIQIGMGGWRRVNPVLYLLTALFALHYFLAR